ERVLVLAMTSTIPAIADRNWPQSTLAWVLQGAVPTKERNRQMTSSDGSAVGGERADLLAMLGKARHFIRFTTRDMTDEQARQRTTVSELTLGGLIKHVAHVERTWARFIVHGSKGAPDF